MFAIMAPMLPTMEAKMSTPTRKSMVTKAYLRRQGSLDARCLGYRVAKWQGPKSYNEINFYPQRKIPDLKGKLGKILLLAQSFYLTLTKRSFNRQF